MFEPDTWDENALEYGYIVTRLADGSWWQMWFGRGTLIYDCELLGRSTNILTSIQCFKPGVVAISPRFILTLDGEGVETPIAELNMNFSWKGQSNGVDLSEEARHFQSEIMPLLYDSIALQNAVREIVNNQRYRKIRTS